METPPPDPAQSLRLPPWVRPGRADTPEDVAFLSGAALSVLHLAAGQAALPGPLWRARLALQAAAACAGFSGRREGVSDLRDALHLTRPGDQPGPGGLIAQSWLRAVARPISAATLQRALPDLTDAQAAVWLDGATGSPVARAAQVLEAVLTSLPQAETTALILADAALSRAIGSGVILPLLAPGLRSRDLRLTGDDLRMACHRAILSSCGAALTAAQDLTRAAARLRAVAPKLRAKGAAHVVDLFLTQDALTPAALTARMSDRAARRICDRLVALGALRELTGRDSFRIYGL